MAYLFPMSVLQLVLLHILTVLGSIYENVIEKYLTDYFLYNAFPSEEILGL